MPLFFRSWLVTLALSFGLLGACLSRVSSPAIVSEVNGVVVVQVVDGLPCDPGVVQI